MKEQNIDQLVQEVIPYLEQLLEQHLTEASQYALEVDFRYADDRKVRKDKAVSKLDLSEVRLVIEFSEKKRDIEPSRFRRQAALDAAPVVSYKRPQHAALNRLIETLDKAEARPGYEFVPLKRFRDEMLPREGFVPGECSGILQDAIDKKIVLTGKVANPRNPQYPVTTVRLNRSAPEVQSIVGGKARSTGFQPVSVRGERLSETVLRDRR